MLYYCTNIGWTESGDSMNTKEEILLRLRQNEGYLSGEQLSEALGVSRAAVWKAITSLRDAGYEIDSATNRGYRLVSSPDVLTPEEVGYGLQTKTLGAKIFAFAEVDSTNEEAKRQAQCGAPDGSVFIAERQTGGKGRLGRAWKSPEGTGIWFSILLRPSLLPTEISNITLLAGIAVCRAVRSVTGCEACIKWPNDVVIGSRKICGILTELAAEIDRVEYIVLGIGINANMEAFPGELAEKATSLRMEAGKSFSRAAVLRAVLEELEPLLKKAQMGNALSYVLDEYKSLCISLHRRVGFFWDGKKQTGTAVDISPLGELIVELDEGGHVAINAGEVVVQGIYGQVLPEAWKTNQ